MCHQDKLRNNIFNYVWNVPGQGQIILVVVINTLHLHFQVTKVKMYDNNHTIPSVIFSKCFSVNLYLPAQPDLIGSEYHMTAIHDVIGDKVEAFDYAFRPSQLEKFPVLPGHNSAQGARNGRCSHPRTEGRSGNGVTRAAPSRAAPRRSSACGTRRWSVSTDISIMCFC